MAFEACHTLVLGVNPDRAAHLRQHLGLEVRRVELWIWAEGKFLEISGSGIRGSGKVIDKRRRKSSEYFHRPLCVRVFCLLAVALLGRIAQQTIESRLFLLLIRLAQGRVVHGNQMSYRSVFCFKD